jgi:23S rRNA pseudouridine2605 synthase
MESTHNKNFPKLQTFLAHAGIASRRKAEVLIEEGKVKVNGEVAHLGQRIYPDKDKVVVSGKEITQPETRCIYLVYKPAGVVSTTQDELGRQTVVDFLRRQIPKTIKLPRLYPVGRLDIDSEGLMILTNDGNMAQEMTHPSNEVAKTYRVTVEGLPSEKALSHLARGVKLKEGMTAPAEVSVVNLSKHESVIDVTIHEGRNHQVKRMFLRIGYPVLKLIRLQMGPYSVDTLKGKPYLKIEQ